MEFCTRAKKCVAAITFRAFRTRRGPRIRCILLWSGKLGHSQEGESRSWFQRFEEERWQILFKGSWTNLRDRWTVHAFIFGPFTGRLLVKHPRVNRAHSFALHLSVIMHLSASSWINWRCFARLGPSSTRLVMMPLNFPHAVNNL